MTKIICERSAGHFKYLHVMIFKAKPSSQEVTDQVKKIIATVTLRFSGSMWCAGLHPWHVLPPRDWQNLCIWYFQAIANNTDICACYYYR